MNNVLQQLRKELDKLKEQVALLQRGQGSTDNLQAINIEQHSDVFDVPRQTETGELREKRRQRAAVHIVRTMEQAYSQEDLMQLCFVFHIDYESIPGETKRDKIRSLVKHFYHRNTLRVFVEFLEKDRPNWTWRVKSTGE